MNNVVAIMRAANFAAQMHAKQRRKGEDAEPYVNHLIEVALLAGEATTGDPDVVVASLLHDTVEDQGVRIEEIAERFGVKVAGFVEEGTDDKSKDKQDRKDLQVANAAHKSEGASVIKIADKTSNLRAIAKSPPPWPLERKRTYLAWAREVVAGLPHKPSGLHAEFEKAAGELEALLH
jgi:(p)ppGpp synthase/HD superfamily hydrolase